jgi:hypothetical protein
MVFMAKNDVSRRKENSHKNNGSLILLGLFAATLLLVVGLSALSLKLLAPKPTVEPEQLQAAAAATLAVVVPLYVDETLNAALPGLIAGTLTARAPTATPIPPTPTQPVTPCDLAGFVSDGALPDGSRLKTTTPFTKVWTIRNMGTCTWAEDYALVFSGGELMAGKSPLTIGRELAPGDAFEISANMVAPAISGLYSSQWLLQNSAGETFGLSPDSAPLSLFISVGSHDSIAMDLTESACQAEWTSSTGSVDCPETEDIAGGIVNPVEFAAGEGGIAFTQPVLEVIPNEGPGGEIKGTYGLFQIQPGDSFHAVLACADNQPDCSLVFELLYDPGDHHLVSVRRWVEVTDGAHQKVVVDLSALAGETIRLILSVSSQTGTAYDNKGLWISPVILRTVK